MKAIVTQPHPVMRFSTPRHPQASLSARPLSAHHTRCNYGACPPIERSTSSTWEYFGAGPGCRQRRAAAPSTLRRRDYGEVLGLAGEILRHRRHECRRGGDDEGGEYSSFCSFGLIPTMSQTCNSNAIIGVASRVKKVSSTTKRLVFFLIFSITSADSSIFSV